MSEQNKDQWQIDGQARYGYVPGPVKPAGQLKVLVIPSIDSEWPKSAVVYPDRPTEWFDDTDQAVAAAKIYCGPHSFTSHDGKKLWVYQSDDLSDWDTSPHHESPDTRFSEAEGGEL